jgi:hypothetical protein
MLRAALGITRSDSPRGLLKASVFVERERVAAAALAPISDPSLSSVQRSKAALALIDAVDPPSRVEVEVPLPTTPDGVMALSLEELEHVAERLGIETGS